MERDKKISLKIPAQRNPFVVLALKRKAGGHRKSNKALRKANEMRLKKSADESGFRFGQCFVFMKSPTAKPEL